MGSGFATGLQTLEPRRVAAIAGRCRRISRRCVVVRASHVPYKELREVAEKAALAGKEVSSAALFTPELLAHDCNS